MAKKVKYPAPNSSDLRGRGVAPYEYTATRKNNPEVGLITLDTDPALFSRAAIGVWWWKVIDERGIESLKVLNLE